VAESDEKLSLLHPFRALRRILPRGLFGRSLIIIVAPVVLLQGVVTYVFFERDLRETTRRMAIDVAADVALLISQEDSYASPLREQQRALSARMLRYSIVFIPGAHVTPSIRRHTTTIDDVLEDVITAQIGERRHHRIVSVEKDLELDVDVHDGLLRLRIPRERVTVDKPDIFILWMVGSSLILMGVAIVFLRNQVRPIERLARAAEAFGKGRAVPDFKPYGATEVRRAAQAFIEMRERIDRHVQQRTEMLAGVSHDLKTPLTRIKLQLAMLDANAADIEALRADTVEMERMLDEYLQFARGEGGEKAEETDLGALLQDAAQSAARARKSEGRIVVDTADSEVLTVRRNAMKRCITNLIDNALKHGRRVEARLRRIDGFVEIVVDDDGPGIPETRREEAFRAFHRLDEGRNLQAGGVGLGLAIARDMARAHGGDLLLGDGPLGGLRATIRLPV
jgi:two-component system osmolarity sensor histidine kinase EnvZ